MASHLPPISGIVAIYPRNYANTNTGARLLLSTGHCNRVIARMSNRINRGFSRRGIDAAALAALFGALMSYVVITDNPAAAALFPVIRWIVAGFARD